MENVTTVKPISSPMQEKAAPEPGKKVAFGTFKGVFLPSILTIFGVIMYLRMGWMVGNVGLAGAVVIITVATAVTFFTALSISATATNMKVGGGGAYFMISRSFGVEAGAAIGLPLYFAQALGVSFYIAGFAEALHGSFPMFDPKAIAVVSLGILAVLAYISADLALKAQFLIFLVIVASLISFFMGGPPASGFVSPEAAAAKVRFWEVFAVFFPAVTGIEAGISMSGNLKNASRSLPVGTGLAVVSGFIVYVAIAWLLARHVPEGVLISNNLVMRDVAYVGAAVIAGVWGATLSSALGALLGAPRTLQALARDRVVPGFLGKGFGTQDEPRIATAVSFLIALGGVLLGDLNVIAPILSMFFLTSYGVLNLAAAVEGIIGNPAWRPTFRTPWIASLAGAILCVSIMIMIDPGATYVAIGLVTGVYYVMRKRGMRARWGDIRRGMLMFMARYSIYKLAEFSQNARSWRPHILVLSGSPNERWHLIEFADAITHGKSILTVASVVTGNGVSAERIENLERSMKQFLGKRGVNALVEVLPADSDVAGAQSLIQCYGMGQLTPNTILLGDSRKPDRYGPFCTLLLSVYRSKRNLVIVSEGLGDAASGSLKSQGGLFGMFKPRKSKRIDVWWNGRQRENAGLMLALAYMLQTSPEWRGAELRLKTFVKNELQRRSATEHLETYVEECRIVAEIEVLVGNPDEDPLVQIGRFSRGADIVFMGMRPPEAGESSDEYQKYYAELMAQTEKFPPTAMVIASQNISFDGIFQ